MEKKILSRPPVVVVLGHVDHGKTTLLDKIRKTNLADKEAGAITQHIGAYQVSWQGKKITFIDTPGHEAFSKMRARGGKVADLAVLVVAADDGVMPQTKESLDHLKAAGIPFIVAINKIDLATAQVEKVKKQLAKLGIKVEGLGGDVVAVAISAKTGQGVDELLEMTLLLSEMAGLKADPAGALEVVVIESKLDRRRGSVATLLVKNGTLRLGDEVLAQEVLGKVRAMLSDKGESLKEAGPGTPVEVLGFSSPPPIGAPVLAYQEGLITPEVKRPEKILPQEVKLRLILKADVAGSLEAISSSLAGKEVEMVGGGIGDISESDILLAKTTGATVVGFNVKISATAQALAETENVKVKTYQLIYKLLEEITEVIKAIGAPAKEESLGKAEIIAEFSIKKGRVAGCRILEGRLALGDKVKVLRGEKEIGQARIKSLKQQQEAINKAEMGQECGVLLEPLLDFNLGDVVISYKE